MDSTTHELRGKRVLVVGLGASGEAAARLLVREGAVVTVNDMRDEAALGDRAAVARELGVNLVTGSHPVGLFEGADVIVVSPGVPPLPALDAASAAGVPIWSEIELASRFVRGRIVAITGTNGKSTVTTLVGQMCEAAGLPTFVGGNLGRPLVEVVGTEAAEAGGVVVVELSSFQLERVERFRADVAALLNVTDDHLDRYDDFEGYVAAKARIFERQRPSDVAILPLRDDRVEAAADTEGVRHRFSATETIPAGTPGIGRRDGYLRDADGGFSFPIEALRIRGLHNVANAAAAVACARALGLDQAPIEATLRSFAGLPHRMEHVADVDGVAYFDDSKATNVGAAVAAIDGLRELDEEGHKVVLIAGGRDKGGSYAPLLAAMQARGRCTVTLGDAAPLIEAAFGEAASTQRAQDMDEAVALARAVAQPGDAVVLAPACSSFDRYPSYAARGDDFQRAVRAMVGSGREAS